MKEKIKAIALSGGGAHTLSYLGLWKYIHDDHHYCPDIISGTSGGALCGCFMAAGLDATVIKKKILEINPKHLFQIAPARWLTHFVSSWGIVNTDKIQEMIKDTLDEFDITWDSFQDTKFQCVVTDLNDGSRVYCPDELDMPLDVAITASIAIPGVFEPIRYGSSHKEAHFYVDGGVCEGFPIKSLVEDDFSDFKIMAVTHSDPREKKHIQISKLSEYFQALSNAVLSSKSVDMLDLLDSDRGDIILFTGSQAKKALDFSKETIEKNFALGYERANKYSKEIDAFFQ